MEPAVPRFDAIINQHAQQLSESAEAKVFMADLCRLFQLRLDLADRFEAANPGPVLAAWGLDHPTERDSGGDRRA